MCPCKDTRKIIQHFSYSLDNSIGKGFSSVVYRGVNDKTGGTVAIKVINLHQLKQSVLPSLLNAQIDILQSLNHKNILKCEGVFITVNNCYIMTEYCDCGDLASLLSRKRRLEEYETIFMMKEICEGYQYLRSKGIIHRDIKPANILINQGIPRIGDFGFAKLDSVVQKEKFRIGSPLYMSPKALN